LLSSIYYLYDTDYRLRKYITVCLRKRFNTFIENSPSTERGKCDEAYELAVCYYLGFGTPRSLKSARIALLESSKQYEELEAEMHLLKANNGRDAIVAGITPRHFQAGKFQEIFDKEENLEVMDSFPMEDQRKEVLELATIEFERELLEIQTALGIGHCLTLTVQASLIGTYRARGMMLKVVELQEKLLVTLMTESRTEANPSIFDSAINLVVAYSELGHFSKAKEILKIWIPISEKVSGETHHATIRAKHELASLYQNMGRLDESETIFLQVLKARQNRYGPSHPNTISVMAQLAILYCAQKKFEKAAQLLEKAVSMGEAVMGASHPSVLTYKSNLTTVYSLDSRNWAKMLPLMEYIARERAKALGEEHRETLISRANLAVMYTNMGQMKKGIPLQEEVLRARAKVLGELHPDTMISAQNLALAYMRLNRCREAIDLLYDVTTLKTQIYGSENPSTIESSKLLMEAKLHAEHSGADVSGFTHRKVKG
jgi:tetratricopeptide (TPR) repeat protein